jgi:hypothetical protein
VNLGGDITSECVVVLAEVRELGLPAVAPDTEASGVEFGVESCGTQGGEGGCFSFHFLDLVFGLRLGGAGIEPAPGGWLDCKSFFAEDSSGLMDVQESLVQVVDKCLKQESFLAFSDFGGFVKSV